MIDGKEGKFFAQDSRNNVLLSETMSIPSQGEAIIRIPATPKCRRRSRSGIESCMADQNSDAIASLMIRFYGNLRRRGLRAAH